MKTMTHLIFSAFCLAAATSALGQPRFTVQPTNQMVAQGFSVTLRAVAATASPPLAYQWYFNSSAVAGALTNVLTINNAQATNSGEYFAMANDSIGSVTSKLATLTVMLPAKLDPKIGANIRLGDDPSTLPASRRAQTETHLARSWTDPNLLVATCMEGSSTDAALDCGFSFSTDGGMTWSARAFIPGLSTLSGGTAPRAGDAVSAIDASGNIFATTLSANPAANQAIDMFISKSSDSGQSFGPPRSLIHAVPKSWPDKESIAINTFRDSPTFNRIAVAFTYVPPGGDPGQRGRITCIYSDDGGVTWSQPTQVGLPDATYAQPFFFRDGSLAIICERVYQDPSVLLVDECVFSKDGGATFGEPTLAMDITGLNYHDPAVAAYSDVSACSDRQAGVLYTTAAVLQGPTTNQIPRVLFAKSIDQGQTWTKPIPVNDTPGGGSVFQPTITASPDGQHVMIAFYDKRNSAGHDYLVDYYLAESFDGGDTWEPNLRLSEFTIDLRKSPFVGDGVWLGDYQGLVPALNFDTPAVAAWIDTRAGNNDPYVVRINRTKGTTFDAWRKLRFSTNDLANAALSSPDGDPDGDGLSNLAEYAFGLEPVRTDSSPLKIFKGPGNTTPKVLVAYERLAVLGDIQFSWQVSDNLVSWVAANGEQEKITPGRDPSMQHVETSFPAGDKIKFLRLGLTRIEPAP